MKARCISYLFAGAGLTAAIALFASFLREEEAPMEELPELTRTSTPQNDPPNSPAQNPQRQKIIRTIPKTAHDESLHETLALAAKDVGAAIAKAKATYGGAELRRTLVFLAQEATSQDWSKLTAFLAELPNVSDQQAVMSLLARRAVSRDAVRFTKFANGQPSANLRGQLLRYTVYALVAENRIPEALSIFESMEAPQRRESLYSIAQEMGRRDVTGAVAWASRLASKDEQNAALTSLVLYFCGARNADGIRKIASTTQDPGIQAMCTRQLATFDQAKIPFTTLPATSVNR